LFFIHCEARLHGAWRFATRLAKNVSGGRSGRGGRRSSNPAEIDEADGAPSAEAGYRISA
jgi:hypothetical protein